MTIRVLHLNTERTWRGGERQTWFLAHELSVRGLWSNIAARPGLPLARRAFETGMRVIPLSPWAEFDPWAVAALRRVMRQDSVNILHAHTGHALGLGALAVRGTPASLVGTRRVDFALRSGVLTRWKYRQASAVVAISHRVREELLAAGVPDKKITVIPSGVDTRGYPTFRDRDRLRQQMGFRPRDVLMVHVGALVPHKGQATLVRAAAQVVRQKPAAHLLILGDGPLAPALKALARSEGVEHHVQFLGHRSDALEYTALADVFVFSSVEEGLGTALLDAMAMGVPTVATRAGGIPDLYQGPASPELSPPGDPPALAENILHVLNDPQEAEARRERGLRRVQDFTVKAMADRYEDLYTKILENR